MGSLRIFTSAEAAWAVRWAKSHPHGLPKGYGDKAYADFKERFTEHAKSLTRPQIVALVSRSAHDAGIKLTKQRSNVNGAKKHSVVAEVLAREVMARVRKMTDANDGEGLAKLLEGLS